jgi:hypothetical protein
MRRIAVVISIFVLLLSSLMLFAIPAYAANGQLCVVFQATFRNDTGSTASSTVDLYDTPATAQYSTTLTLQPGQSGDARVSGFFPEAAVTITADSYGALTYVAEVFFDFAPDSECSGGGFGRINDGRVNALDLAAPLAAYCVDGGLAVWDIDASGQGTLGFTATKQQIADAVAGAKSSGQNALIGEGLGNSLYALSTGELSLIGPDVKEPGKTYTSILPANICG